MNKNTIDKAEILKQIDFSAFYKEQIPSLQINGKPDALGLCLFHNDRNPSLSVNIETGLYRCFSCGAKGDVFRFYQETNGVDFPTALRELAVFAGVNGVQGGNFQASSELRRRRVLEKAFERWAFDYAKELGETLRLIHRIEQYVTPENFYIEKEIASYHLDILLSDNIASKLALWRVVTWQK